ncbi:hypothetical protein CB1_000507012 [Camelus ferus]|nr:hypothetical protein CB1_000507012 [Camelus ferus]
MTPPAVVKADSADLPVAEMLVSCHGSEQVNRADGSVIVEHLSAATSAIAPELLCACGSVFAFYAQLFPSWALFWCEGNSPLTGSTAVTDSARPTGVPGSPSLLGVPRPPPACPAAAQMLPPPGSLHPAAARQPRNLPQLLLLLPASGVCPGPLTSGTLRIAR